MLEALKEHLKIGVRPYKSTQKSTQKQRHTRHGPSRFVPEVCKLGCVESETAEVLGARYCVG